MRRREDLSFEEVLEMRGSKIRRAFRINPRAQMTRTKLLEKVKPFCAGGTPTDFWMSKTIHELRKLAGYNQLVKGYKKEDYVRIIREGG